MAKENYSLLVFTESGYTDAWNGTKYARIDEVEFMENSL